ncbi:MAG TPA: aldo/keto reductase, partial [Planctomycetota bacterium]|nr:aldo/keto reductase [Planctomycetota bacterium]
MNTARDDLNRREFLGIGVGLGVALAAGGLCDWTIERALAEPVDKLAENIPATVLGRTGWKTKIVGLGTIFRPESKWTMKESDDLLNSLIDIGINVFEIGVVYGESEERFGRVVTKDRRDKLFISSKSTKITKEGFMKDLEASLVKLRTDHVDCYMLHNYSTF